MDDENEVTFVVEKDEVAELIGRIEDEDGRVEPHVYHRIQTIVRLRLFYGIPPVGPHDRSSVALSPARFRRLSTRPVASRVSRCLSDS